MHNEILLSIILPVYNVEPFLEDCIRSIERIKTAKEVICINDGSTDNSMVCLQKLADEFDDIVISQQENKGVSATRNKGISLAKGKYICFVDSDDMVIAETIDSAVLLLEKETADCIVYDYKNIAENSHYHDFFNSYCEKQITTVSHDIKILYADHYIWKSIMKKEFLDDNAICFPAMRYFEDQCFMKALCARHPNTISIAEPGYLYRARSSSAMHCESRCKPWATDAIKGAVYVKNLEEKTTNTEFKEYCRKNIQLLRLHAMTMGMMVPEFNAKQFIQMLKDNGLFPFKPMWRLLIPNGKITLLNFLRFGFFSKAYYTFFFKLIRKIKKIR